MFHHIEGDDIIILNNILNIVRNSINTIVLQNVFQNVSQLVKYVFYNYIIIVKTIIKYITITE